MKLAIMTLALLATPSLAVPLTVGVGDTVVFAIDHGQPVLARKVAPTAKPSRGEVKVAVRALFGTMMTITNNSATGYTFQAQLIGADGKTVVGRTCTLPPGNQPALESWPQKAVSVRIADFKPAKGGRC